MGQCLQDISHSQVVLRFSLLPPNNLSLGKNTLKIQDFLKVLGNICVNVYESWGILCDGSGTGATWSIDNDVVINNYVNYI